MIGSQPFSVSAEASLQNNLARADFKVKFTDDNRVSLWKCPASARGRYIRIQLEGFNFLCLAEVEVFGKTFF